MKRLKLNLMAYHIKRQKNFLFIFFILTAATFPVPVLIRLLTRHNVVHETVNALPSFYSNLAFLLFVTVILMMIVPFIFFDYLFSKRSVDVFHSLPIKRSDLFNTYALLSYLFVWIPFALSYWIGTLILMVGFKTPPNSYMITTFFQISAILFATQVPTNFVIMNTGTLADGLIYTSLFFIIPFIGFGAFQTFSTRFIFGIGSLSLSKYITFISPVFALVTAPFKMFENITFTGAAAYWLIAATCLQLISRRLYKQFKSENSQKPFTNQWFFPFVASLFVCFLLVFALSLNDYENIKGIMNFIAPQALLIPVLVSYVIYVLLDFVRLRSARSIKKTTRNYGIVLVTTIAISMLLYSTQGFGYAWKLPQKKSIQSVSITVSSYTTPLLPEFINADSSNYSPDTEYRFQSPKGIDVVYSIHEKLVDALHDNFSIFKSNKEPETFDSSEITLTYYLERSGKSTRTFTLPPEAYQWLTALYDTPEIQEMMKTSSTDLSQYKVFSSKFDQEVKVEKVTDASALQKALQTDLERVDLKARFLNPVPLRYIIRNLDAHNLYYYIDDQFTETMAFLASQEHIPFNGNLAHTDRERKPYQNGLYIANVSYDLNHYDYSPNETFEILTPHYSTELLDYLLIRHQDDISGLYYDFAVPLK